MTRPLLIDAYCGAGGCSEGYRRAGFDVVGIDLHPQPRYPFPFVQADALDALERLLRGEVLRIDGRPALALADVAGIHASPPCQRWSPTQVRWGREHPDLIAPTRKLLRATGLPYVIENVPGAPLLEPVKLCGSSFGLRVRRHRGFEANFLITPRPCAHPWQDDDDIYPAEWTRSKRPGRTGVVSVYGNGGGGPGKAPLEERAKAMGIDWMNAAELGEAIPPAYTEHIGLHLRMDLAERRAA